jgi:pimeloyl-ACP methyl ester carboxylesterase
MKVLEFGTENTGPATLFLHGFPGVRSKQNKDLAEKASRLGRRCFVPLYAGLGQAEGEFSFLKCRDQVRSFAKELLQAHGTLDLVGHSWGGYLALGIAAEEQEKIDRLVLMSPLLYFFTLDLAQQAFRMTAEGNQALHLGVTDDLAREFHTLGNKDRAEDLARAVSAETKVSIFQAASDDTTPASYAESLVNRFKKRPSYEAVVTDHSFLVNRERALDRVLTALAIDNP